MAKSHPPSTPIQCFLLIFLVTFYAAEASGGGDERFLANLHEHEAMIGAIRDNGYVLFANAIETSDLRLELLKQGSGEEEGSGTQFTLFAPRNELIYAVDLAYNATEYVDILRHHVIPNRRHSYEDLQNLTVRSLETLIPENSVAIEETRDVDSLRYPSGGLMVDGVRISNRNLFLGPRLAVHGIDGILLIEASLMSGLDFSNNDVANFPSPSESPYPVAGSVGHTTAEAPMSQFDTNAAPGASPTQATAVLAEDLVKKRRNKRNRSPALRRGNRRHHHRHNRPGDL